MEALLERLMEAPDLQILIDKAQKKLWQEKKKRMEFYEWLTDEAKAEFINGEIVVHSPVVRAHLDVSERLSTLLSVFTKLKKLGKISVEKALVSLTRNDYEPDICFWGNEKAATFTEDMMHHPAPDFVVEILSKGTAKRDRGVKFEDYAAHGVQEYWIIDPQNKTIEQYLLRDNERREFILKQKAGEKNTIESPVITGFLIPVKAIFDEKANLDTLQNLMKN